MSQVGQGLAPLVDYRKACGDADVPRGWRTADGFRLGEWLYRRRLEHQRGTLDPATDQALTALGVTWSPLTPSQKRALDSCRQFVAGHGHLRVPRRHVGPHGVDLRGFVDRSRQSWRQGTLTPAVAQALSALDPDWAVTGAAALAAAGPFLAAAAAWHTTTGDLAVPRRYITADGTQLGNWLTQRRRQHRAGTLPAHIRQALNDLDPSWTAPTRPGSPGRHTDAAPPPLARWRGHLDAIAERATVYGDANVPRRYVTAAGLRLGGWLAERRRDYRRGRLDPDLATELTQLGVMLDPAARRARPTPPRRRAAPRPGGARTPAAPTAAVPPPLVRWRDHLDAVAMYATDHGDPNVPRRHITATGLRLGGWLAARRDDFRHGRLDTDIAAALTRLGVTIDPAAARNAAGIEACQRFVADHGHLRIPPGTRTADGYKVGGFLTACRTAHSHGQLPPPIHTALSTLDPNWHTPPPTWSDTTIAAVRAWHAQQQHLRIPVDHITDDGLQLGQVAGPTPPRTPSRHPPTRRRPDPRRPRPGLGRHPPQRQTRPALAQLCRRADRVPGRARPPPRAGQRDHPGRAQRRRLALPTTSPTRPRPRRP